MTTRTPDPAAALDAFTLAVMASCGQLSLIIDHMHRFRAESQSTEENDSVPAVLHRLLRDVLTPLAEEHDVADLATAAQMLETATQRIGDEMFFDDPIPRKL